MSLPESFWLQFGADACRELYISWREDGTNTAPELHWRERGSEDAWTTVAGTSLLWGWTGDESTLDPPRPERRVQRAFLDDLDPGMEIEFRMGAFTDVRWSRTMPEERTAEPYRMVVLGDVGWGTSANHVLQHVPAWAPDAVLFGGDFAYCKGLEDLADRWDDLLGLMRARFGREDGYMAPILPVLGNQELSPTFGSWEDRDERGRLFFRFFVFPEGQGAHQAHRAGDWLHLVTIDGEYTTPTVTGEDPQSVWLQGVYDTLGATEIAYRMAAVHAPPYPGGVSTQSGMQNRLRQHVVPIMEAAGIKTFWTFHEHIYCRTHPLLNDEVDPDGVIHFGAGAAGRGPLTPIKPDPWYVAESYGRHHNPIRGRHFYVADFAEEGLTVTSVDSQGNAFHTYSDVPTTYQYRGFYASEPLGDPTQGTLWFNWQQGFEMPAPFASSGDLYLYVQARDADTEEEGQFASIQLVLDASEDLEYLGEYSVGSSPVPPGQREHWFDWQEELEAPAPEVPGGPFVLYVRARSTLTQEEGEEAVLPLTMDTNVGRIRFGSVAPVAIRFEEQEVEAVYLGGVRVWPE